jgi:hypothetical protein
MTQLENSTGPKPENRGAGSQTSANNPPTRTRLTATDRASLVRLSRLLDAGLTPYSALLALASRARTGSRVHGVILAPAVHAGSGDPLTCPLPVRGDNHVPEFESAGTSPPQAT